jgi:hypothetical protein
MAMHRPAAAGADQRIPARVAAALGDMDTGGAGHAFVDDLVDALSGRLRRDAELPGKSRDRAPGGGEVDRDAAVGEEIRVLVVDDEVGEGAADINPEGIIAHGTETQPMPAAV